MSSSCDAASGPDHAAPPLRLLFVSGVSIGGAPRSTIELAQLLHERGHDVAVVVGDRDLAPRWYQPGVRLAIKAGDGVLSRALRRVLRRAGRRTAPTGRPGVPVWR